LRPHKCDYLLSKLDLEHVRGFSKFDFTEVLFPGIAAAEGE
jgi:hypothetical protein